MVEAMRQDGFTYLAVLFLVALMGVVLAGAGTVWRTAAQRDKERELLHIGNQFRLAIASYYEHSPGSLKKYPPSLNVLLKDSRFPDTRRHLRRIYRDPMTGSTDWGVVMAPEGGIMGVHSLSPEQPLKSGNFRGADKALTGQAMYSGWVFFYQPRQANPAMSK
jgi:type II secretory pathway pseudopilin PulG